MPVNPVQAAAPPFVLGLDLGTSSVRAIIFDSAGRRVEAAVSQIPYKMATTPDGGVEIDADLLLEILCRAIDGALGSADLKIEAVGFSTFWHSLMGVDEKGRPLTPLYSWNDTRAASAARWLQDEIDERALHARTGCMLHASYWPAKLAWLRSDAGETFSRVARWISIGEYVYFRLFGRAVASVSMASATGLFDQNQCSWDRKILFHLGIDPNHLSGLDEVRDGLYGLADQYRMRWPLLASARWFPAIGDGACANIGSGCVTVDRFALTLGTSGAIRALWKAQSVTVPRGLWCYRADRRRFVMGGALSNGGDMFAWMTQTLRLGELDELGPQVDSIEADSHGLTVLPFLSGERSTGWREEARAVISGLSLDTTPVEILRAGMESVAYRLAAVYDLLIKEVGAPREIVASGAAVLRSSAWAQIITDVIGKQIIASAQTEASCRGAALLALESLGVIPAIEEVEAETGTIYSPDARRHARYLAARERQERLYRSILG
jgi:gluconokinase